MQEKPSSIPTAQGLLILGGRECACGNHSQGFLYTAMGLSMAIDLGVHLDGTKIGAMNHDPMETEVRKRLYWSSYLWDKSISLCLGRAPRFLKSDKSFFGPAPIFDKSEDDVPWRPQFTEMPEDLQHYPFFPFRSGIYFEKTCQLAEIIEEILLELYAGKRKPNGNLSLRRYTSMLESWRENLHPDLVIPPDAVVSPPPNRITLSMLYQATVILVNRPFSFGGWGPRLRASEELRADAKQRCRTAAHEIARLLQLYDQTFQFRNMNWLMGYCSYTAATIIVFDLHAPVADVAREAGKHLEVILASLGSQTTVTPSVQRSIEIIRHLMVNAPPASGTVTPLTAHAAKRHKDQSVGSDTIGAWTFEALNPPHAAAEQGAPSDSADFSSLQLPDDVLGELLASAGPLDPADPSGASGLPPPILPEFPEAGPLSWLGASEDASRDWLSSYNWLQFGAPQ
ncbi:hypothetical protein Rhopal_003880-T1 [Rhodotorula paludigena]|uniref:Xylanolytic transcriptional activator regulatory domain-containing protein n=1 Tax=Rhodotorula paludigena TaxID=86838 RepID=A0AAV5GMV0_9BASI|nr:hypothetical protein Rhopal_003880-T1 [Rhodotorula paludigena]